MCGCQEYLLDNDCIASLVAVLTQIQYGSVPRSYQLLQCMATRLDPIEAGGHIVPLQIFAFLCQNCPLFSSSSFRLNIGIKYN